VAPPHADQRVEPHAPLTEEQEELSLLLRAVLVVRDTLDRSVTPVMAMLIMAMRVRPMLLGVPQQPDNMQTVVVELFKDPTKGWRDLAHIMRLTVMTLFCGGRTVASSHFKGEQPETLATEAASAGLNPKRVKQWVSRRVGIRDEVDLINGDDSPGDLTPAERLRLRTYFLSSVGSNGVLQAGCQLIDGVDAEGQNIRASKLRFNWNLTFPLTATLGAIFTDLNKSLISVPYGPRTIVHKMPGAGAPPASMAARGRKRATGTAAAAAHMRKKARLTQNNLLGAVPAAAISCGRDLVTGELQPSRSWPYGGWVATVGLPSWLDDMIDGTLGLDIALSSTGRKEVDGTCGYTLKITLKPRERPRDHAFLTPPPTAAPLPPLAAIPTPTASGTDLTPLSVRAPVSSPAPPAALSSAPGGLLPPAEELGTAGEPPIGALSTHVWTADGVPVTCRSYDFLFNVRRMLFLRTAQEAGLDVTRLRQSTTSAVTRCSTAVVNTLNSVVHAPLQESLDEEGGSGFAAAMAGNVAGGRAPTRDASLSRLESVDDSKVKITYATPPDDRWLVHHYFASALLLDCCDGTKNRESRYITIGYPALDGTRTARSMSA